MKPPKKTTATFLIALLTTGCADSFTDRTLPQHPKRNVSTVVDVRSEATKLQDAYKKLIDAYNADTTNFNLAYIAIATFTSASAIFGANIDFLKAAGLLAGVTITGQEVLSPKQKSDALYAAQDKVSCVLTTSLPLLQIQRTQRQFSVYAVPTGSPGAGSARGLSRSAVAYSVFDSMKSVVPTEKIAVATIEAALRKIHSDLIKEFRGTRLDPKAQAERYIAAAEEYEKFRKDNDEATGEIRNQRGTTIPLQRSILRLAKNSEKLVEAIAEIEKCAI